MTNQYNQMAEIQEIVTLICKDDQKVEVAQNIAEKAKLIENILEGNDEKTIDISAKCSKPVCEKALEFCKKLAEGVEMPEISKPLGDKGIECVGPWFIDYITKDVSKEELFELVEIGGKYLNIEPLMQLGCAKIALDIKDKFIVDIRQYFNCEDDVPNFTAAEEEKISDENIWIDEN